MFTQSPGKRVPGVQPGHRGTGQLTTFERNLPGGENFDFSNFLETLGKSSETGALRGGALRRIFALLADLEVANREGAALNTKMLVHHVSSLSPIIARMARHSSEYFVQMLFNAWFTSVSRDIRDRYALEIEDKANRINQSLQEQQRNATLRSALCFSAQPTKKAQDAHIRAMIAAWNQCAIVGNRFLGLMYRTIDLAPSSKLARFRAFTAAFLSWRVEAAFSLTARKSEKYREDRKALQLELRQVRQDTLGVMHQLQVSTRQGNTFRERCHEARRLLHKNKGLIHSTKETELLETPTPGASSSKELPVLERKRESIASEYSLVMRTMQELTDQLEVANEMVEAIDRRIDRVALQTHNDSGYAPALEREKEEALKHGDELENELTQLKVRESRLKRAAEEVELAVAAAHVGERDEGTMLIEELRDNQKAFERILGSQRESTRTLQAEFRKAEIECIHLENELGAAREQNGQDVEKAAAHAALELRHERARSQSLVAQLKEAQQWIDYLRQEDGHAMEKRMELKGKGVEIHQLVGALATLTQANELYVSKGGSPEATREIAALTSAAKSAAARAPESPVVPAAFYPRSASGSPVPHNRHVLASPEPHHGVQGRNVGPAVATAMRDLYVGAHAGQVGHAGRANHGGHASHGVHSSPVGHASHAGHGHALPTPVVRAAMGDWFDHAGQAGYVTHTSHLN